MTTHYILADDYDRWNPGEPIEDVASDIQYIEGVFYEFEVQRIGGEETEHRATKAHDLWDKAFARWLAREIAAGNIIKLETNDDGEWYDA